MKRAPDFQIPGYLNRWHIIPRNRWLNIYLHQIIGPDRAQDMHDHPWWSLSLKLRGYYYEVADGDWPYFRDRIVFRPARCLHKIYSVPASPCWTLFITGPVVRDWGFRIPGGGGGKWVRHDVYLHPVHDGGMPSPTPSLSARTKAGLLGAHISHAGRFTEDGDMGAGAYISLIAAACAAILLGLLAALVWGTFQ